MARGTSATVLFKGSLKGEGQKSRSGLLHRDVPARALPGPLRNVPQSLQQPSSQPQLPASAAAQASRLEI